MKIKVKNENNSNAIDLAFAVSGQYAYYVGIVIFSIIKNTNSFVRCHVLHNGLNNEQLNNLDILASNFNNLEINLLNVNNEKIKKIKTAKDNFPETAYYRLILDKLLPNLKKVVYLDADIVVENDIKNLWDFDIDDYYLAACREVDIHSRVSWYLDKLNLQDHPYFNSGVLIMNLEKIREDNISDKLLELAIEKSSYMLFGDQDILNIFFKNNVKLFEAKYNFTDWYLENGYYQQLQPTIIHFTGRFSKPWGEKSEDRKYLYPYLDNYRKLKREYLSLVNSDYGKVSVVVINKSSKHLVECLESIHTQNYNNIEILVISIGEKLLERDNVKTINLEAENSELIMRTIYTNITGDYLLLLDSKDKVSVDYVYELVKNATKNNSDITLTNQVIFNENDGMFYYNKGLFDNNILSTSDIEKIEKDNEGFYYRNIYNKLYKRNYIESNDNYSQLYEYLSDDFYKIAKISYVDRSDYMVRHFKKELISVIIPIYNVENYLDECLNSVITQSYYNLEIILVNDGSTDNSLEICEKYASRDSRIKLINQENKGLSEARNTGIDIFSGDYITFIDSDDVLNKDYIESLHNDIKSYDADIAITNVYQYHHSDGKFYYPIRDNSNLLEVLNSQDCINYQSGTRKISSGNFVVAWGKLYKKEIFEKLYYPAGSLSEDEYLIHKAYLMSDKIVFNTRPRYMYRVRKEGIMGSLNRSKKKIEDDIISFQCRLSDLTIRNMDITATLNKYKKLLYEYKNKLEYDENIENCVYKEIIEQIKLLNINKEV